MILKMGIVLLALIIFALVIYSNQYKKFGKIVNIGVYIFLAGLIAFLLWKGSITDYHSASFFILFMSVLITYHNRKNTGLSKISILLAGLFLSIVTLIYPLYDTYTEHFQRIVYTILCSIQCIYVGQDVEFIQNEIISHGAGINYTMFMNLLFLLAPILTTGVILTLLQQFIHKVKYVTDLLKIWKKEVHVFSNINKESVALAESLYQSRAILVFCNEKENEVKESLKNRIRKIGAITIDTSEIEAKMLTTFGKNVFFYEISEDDIKNMDNAMKLIEKYESKEQVKVTVFSTRKEAEMLLDSTNRKMKVALVNKNRYALYHLLEQRPMIQWSKNGLSSVLIVGEEDSRVLEMVKIILWSMQLDNHDLEIHVVMPETIRTQSMLYHQCPGLKEKKYKVFFHKADIQTEEMDEAIDNYCQNTNYIIVTMKEDRLNIETAIYLREHFLYLDKENYINQPPIHIWLNDEIKGIDELGVNSKNYVLSEKDNEKLGYHFYPFGTTEQIYSEVSILNIKLEELALMLHLSNVGALEKPNKDQEIAKRTYRNRESTRKYSIACAIHMKYSLYTKGIDLFHQNLTPKLVEQIKMLMTNEDVVESLMRSDIRMWNTFWRTEGFRRVSFEETSKYFHNEQIKSHQHTIAKLNPCLTDLEEFEKNEEELEKIRGNRPKLIKVERNYVMKFPIVLEKLLN